MDPSQEQKDFGDTKASLAFSNMLREGKFMEENAPVEPQEGQGDEDIAVTDQGEQIEEVPQVEEVMAPVEQPQTEEKDEEIAELKDEIKSMDKKFKKMIRDEVSGIKEMIKEALNEEEPKENIK